jgi:hypothetical protein
MMQLCRPSTEDNFLMRISLSLPLYDFDIFYRVAGVLPRYCKMIAEKAGLR